MGELNTFSVADANFSAINHIPIYVWQQSYGEILVFTPQNGNIPANIRALSGD